MMPTSTAEFAADPNTVSGLRIKTPPDAAADCRKRRRPVGSLVEVSIISPGDDFILKGEFQANWSIFGKTRANAAPHPMRPVPRFRALTGPGSQRLESELLRYIG
jgi:hypothetical protein